MRKLIYCSKSGPYLTHNVVDISNGYDWYELHKEKSEDSFVFNGTIVGEIEYEIEAVQHYTMVRHDKLFGYYKTNSLKEKELLAKSCLSRPQLHQMVLDQEPDIIPECVAVAYIIKSINVYTNPKKLDVLTRPDWEKNINTCVQEKGKCNHGRSPKTMEWIGCAKTRVKDLTYNMKVIDDKGRETTILELTPQEMFNVLNGNQTVIVRKRQES